MLFMVVLLSSLGCGTITIQLFFYSRGIVKNVISITHEVGTDVPESKKNCFFLKSGTLCCIIEQKMYSLGMMHFSEGNSFPLQRRMKHECNYYHWT